MNATIAWTACGCLAFGWVAGFLFGSNEPPETEAEKMARLFQEGLLEVGIDPAEFEGAAPGADRARAPGPDRSRDRLPVGTGRSSSVLT